MYMIVSVIDQTEHLSAVLASWRKNGIGGVTILESTGLHRLMAQTRIPMRYAFGGPSAERGNITIFTVVESEEMVQRCLELLEEVVGDLGGPNTGIFVAWPLSFTKGVSGTRPDTSG